MHPVTIKDMPKFPFTASLPGAAGNIFMLKNNYLLKQLSLLKPQSCMALCFSTVLGKNAKNYKRLQNASGIIPHPSGNVKALL